MSERPASSQKVRNDQKPSQSIYEKKIIQDNSGCSIMRIDYYSSGEGLDSAVVLGTERSLTYVVIIVCKPRYGIVFCVMSSVFCSFGTVQNNSRGRNKTYM